MIEKTFFSLVTGNSVSAIATFVLFGNKYRDILEKIFIPKNKLKLISTDNINYGVIKFNGTIYDEVIIKIYEDTKVFPYIPHCEINIHGSIGIIKALKNLFKSLGLYEASKTALLQYALKNRKINYLQKELYYELFHSRSKKYTELLLEEKRKSFLEYIISNYENTGLLAELLQLLLNKYTILSKFKKSVKVGIFGSTNAGKSTLFNYLINTPLAITSPVPGTTRDYISYTVHFKDFSIEFLDTAGLWKSDDFINIRTKEITKKLWNLKNILRVVVFSYDAPVPEELVNTADTENIILVYNKIDMEESNTKLACNNNEAIRISALKGVNVEMLLEKIKERLKLDEFLNMTNPVIFTRRQQILVSRMLQLLNNNEKSKLKSIINEIIYSKGESEFIDKII